MIVPVLNEEVQVAGLLDSLAAIAGIHEVIVVDGGSADGTVDAVERAPDVRLLVASRGRGRQMNAGARAATGDVLLFLHADVRLPPDAADWVDRTFADPGVIAGAFRTWTVDEGRRSGLAPLLHLADLRSRFTGLPYGDQALFVRAGIFTRLGGFPEQPLMEDLEFSRRLRATGRIRIVPATVRVSGRRFLSRPIYHAFVMKLFPLLYGLGVPPHALARRYPDVR